MMLDLLPVLIPQSHNIISSGKVDLIIIIIIITDLIMKKMKANLTQVTQQNRNPIIESHTVNLIVNLIVKSMMQALNFLSAFPIRDTLTAQLIPQMKKR